MFDVILSYEYTAVTIILKKLHKKFHPFRENEEKNIVEFNKNCLFKYFKKRPQKTITNF